MLNGGLFTRNTLLRICVCAPQGHSSGGAQGSGCDFVYPGATLQAEHKTQDACLCTPGQFFGRCTSLRTNVCTPQGYSSAGTQGSGYVFVHPRVTLQPGHKAQDASLCALGPLFSRDKKLRIRVCVPQGDSSGGTQSSGCVFVEPRATFQAGHTAQETVCAAQGHSSAGTQSLGYVLAQPRATLQPGQGV